MLRIEWLVQFCAVANGDRLIDKSGLLQECWQGERLQVREQCCGSAPPAECFNGLFTRAACCSTVPARHSACSLLQPDSAPWPSSEVLTVDLADVHHGTSGISPACWADGWRGFYAVHRGVGDGRMRGRVLCLPVSCGESVDVAEVLSRLGLGVADPDTVILSVALGEMSWRVGNNPEGALVERNVSFEDVLCLGEACETMLGRTLSDAAVVAVDIGAWSRSEFLPWLGDDREGKRWVLALEPDPRDAAEHPPHPRLAMIVAAAGHPGTTGRSLLHRANFTPCNSLRPPRPDARAMATRLGLSTHAANCMAPRDQPPVPVRVVSLASVLARMPPGKDVALLKIDAQGMDLEVVQSAGAELRRVQWLVVEVQDLPAGHELLMYGPAQPAKEDLVKALAARGFCLDSCVTNTAEMREENCLFLRADRLGTTPDELVGEYLQPQMPFR